MGRLTQWSYESADAILAAIATLGGFIIGAIAEGVVGAVAGGITVPMFTLLLAHALEPRPPEYGPHQ